MLLSHDLPVDKACNEIFNRLEKRSSELGDAFALLKDRIQFIKLSLFNNKEDSEMDM